VLGFADAPSAIGQPMVWEYRPDGEGFFILGVVKNFHQQGLQHAHAPIIFTLDHTQDAYFSCQIRSENIPETLERIAQTYQRMFPGNPFSYFFLDEYFNRQYAADQHFGQVIILFAALAILVACLGLFGLVSFTASQRTKEIGVRKVLGASVRDILVLLNTDFLKPIVLANLIAWPLTWWGMHQWLQNYAFRTSISVWLFVLPSLLVLLIALLTISLQTLKAARANPVDSLRNE
jgi:putative ABC transport system permease protein